MKLILFTFLMGFTAFVAAQSADEYFNSSAYAYVQSNNRDAMEKVVEGLRKYPTNKKLQELKRKIEEQQDSEQQSNKDEQQQQDQNSTQNPDDNDSQQQSGQQDGRNQGNEGTGSSDQDPLNAQGEENAQNNRDQGQRLQQQRFDNVLKAIENQEQDTKRRLMMGKSKSNFGRKQNDW